jgi:hypothetical protein
MPRCTVEDPVLQEARTKRFVACHLFDPDMPQNGQQLPTVEAIEAVQSGANGHVEAQ